MGDIDGTSYVPENMRDNQPRTGRFRLVRLPKLSSVGLAHVCSDCGAVVGDLETHDRWHEWNDGEGLLR